MKLLSRSHPKYRSIFFYTMLGMFFCFLLFSYFAYYVDFLFRNYERFYAVDYVQIFFAILIGILLGCPIILYFIGEIIWQVKGEEILLYDKNYLYIVNKGRIIGNFKKIPWSNIKCIKVLELSSYEQFIVYFSISGEIEERICITRFKGRKIYLGVNLSKTEYDKVIVKIEELMSLYCSKIT